MQGLRLRNELFRKSPYYIKIGFELKINFSKMIFILSINRQK